MVVKIDFDLNKYISNMPRQNLDWLKSRVETEYFRRYGSDDIKLSEDEREFIKNGKKLSAVKSLMGRTGVSLEAAMHHIKRDS